MREIQHEIVCSVQGDWTRYNNNLVLTVNLQETEPGRPVLSIIGVMGDSAGQIYPVCEAKAPAFMPGMKRA